MHYSEVEEKKKEELLLVTCVQLISVTKRKKTYNIPLSLLWTILLPTMLHE